MTLRTRVFSLIVTSATLAGFPPPALAQSSTVTVEPGPGAVMPVPIRPLEVLDTDYPLRSLLGNEQGKVTLQFTIDSSGRPTAIQLASSSGAARLDQQAGQIARTRWQFPPTANNSAIRLSVDWKLPLSVITDLQVHVDNPRLPEGATPAKATNTHAVRADDYPERSLGASEQGTVVLRYAVEENGTVGEVQIVASSGHPRLDDAASKMVNRWTFDAAQANGRPIRSWSSAAVGFNIGPAGVILTRNPPQRCLKQPIVGHDAEETLLITATVMGAAAIGAVERWVYVDPEGRVSDMLIRTNLALMRASKPVVAALAQGARYPRSRNREGCWYHEYYPLSR